MRFGGHSQDSYQDCVQQLMRMSPMRFVNLSDETSGGLSAGIQVFHVAVDPTKHVAQKIGLRSADSSKCDSVIELGQGNDSLGQRITLWGQANRQCARIVTGPVPNQK